MASPTLDSSSTTSKRCVARPRSRQPRRGRGGDPGHVARILRILLDNALRHTPSPGEVRVAYVEHGDAVGIAVEDDGPGVPGEHRERIFARFTRGDHADAGGFGAGLAIGREPARRMDGDLGLEDTAGGARFVLSPPRAVPQ